MKSKFIKINGITDVTMFVKNATEVTGDVEVRRGRWCIDGKSLMGVLSVNVADGITVIYPESATNFEKYIEQFGA